MSVAAFLDPAGCPAAPPQLQAMGAATRSLHEGVDAHIRRRGVAYLHPESPTLMLDALGSDPVIAWQEGKASFLFAGEGCWSELPQLYARYATTAGLRLIRALREAEAASCVILADCGMQATALCFDVLMHPGAHAVIGRQVYNKTRAYLELLARRLGGAVTVIDDGDLEGLAAALRPETALVFFETFTNPRMRAQDPAALGAIVRAARARGCRARLVIDSTIATPWALRRPLLSTPGVDVVVASGTKALAGQDRDMFGYVATCDGEIGNQVMDLVALRGGNLDWRRAEVIAAGLDEAAQLHARRCQGAARIAAFLARHPRVAEVFHPSLPDHPDAAIVAAHYQRCGSLLSLRVRGHDEEAARRFADVLATTVVVRYALSFDGLTTKVNHHRSVSEYFTPPERLAQGGLDRLVRLAVGVEEPDDIIAALNWALHHGDAVSREQLAAWQQARRAALNLSE